MCSPNLSADSQLLEQFGNNVRKERHLIGLSQEALADLALLHRTYVGSIERGERNVSLVNIVKLAKALGVNVGRLLEGI